MRILVAASTFPAGELDGSRPRFIYDLAEALSAHAEVFVLAPHHAGAARSELMGRVRVERFPYWWPTGAQRLTPNMRQQMRGSLLAKLQVPCFLAAQAAATSRLVARHRIEIVNAHWMVPQGLTAALVRGGATRRFRLALHVHAGDVYLLRKIPSGRAITRYITVRTDVAFADGSHVRATWSELLGRDCGAHLQPMGVHCDAFGEGVASDPPSQPATYPDGYVLTVGRLVEKKGTVYLIRALARLRERHPGLGLVVIGDGPEGPALRAEAAKLEMSDRVLFLGHQPHSEIVAHLHQCRAAVVPSIVDRHGETEGMPTVVVEAMAAGARVVASAVDGIPDVVRHRENGWLCREKDPEDLAEKLVEALAEPRDTGVTAAAERTGREHDWEEIARSYMEALRA